MNTSGPRFCYYSSDSTNIGSSETSFMEITPEMHYSTGKRKRNKTEGNIFNKLMKVEDDREQKLKCENNIHKKNLLTFKWKSFNFNQINDYVNKSGFFTYIDSEGEQGILTAAEKGAWEAVKLFLQHGVSIETISKLGKRLIHFAAETNNIPILDYLIKQNADLNAATQEGMCVLHIASEKGYVEVLQWIQSTLNSKNINVRAYFATPNSIASKKYPIQYAAESGNVSTLKFLIDQGADVNQLDEDEEYSPLYLAAREGHTCAVRFLLNQGAQFDDHSLIVSMVNTAGNGYLETFKFLHQECHASLDEADADGYSPADIAAECEQLHVLQYLLDNRANLFSRNACGNTPMILTRSIPVMEFFLKNGADINDNQGITALNKEIVCEDLIIENIEWLLKNGADVYQPERGRNALALLLHHHRDKKANYNAAILRAQEARMSAIKEGLPQLGFGSEQSSVNSIGRLIAQYDLDIENSIPENGVLQENAPLFVDDDIMLDV